MARGSDPIARQRLLGQSREDAHALRGAASACGLTDVAESAGRLESLAAGLHEDDLELGAAGIQELNEVFAKLAAGIPKAGPAAYLQKPIDPAVFLSVVDDLLARRPAPPLDTSHLEIEHALRAGR